MSTPHRPARRAARKGQLWPVLLVVGVVLVGLVAAVAGPWRVGCAVIGAGLLLGAVLRLVLPDRAAGLLQVRGKGFDVLAMGVGGVAVAVLSFWVPGR